MKKIVIAVALCLASLTAVAQKKVSILGDSYSTFENYIPQHYSVWYPSTARQNEPNDVVKPEQTWWMQFIASGDYALEKNNSYSGSTICNTGYYANDFSDRAFTTRVNMLGQPDIIFIFGGTNDSWAGSPIGDYKYGKWTQAELYSFRPALAYLLSTAKMLYPKAEIYFLLNDCLKPEINESVEKICGKYRIKLIKLHDIDKQTGHPSCLGMTAISEQIQEFLAK